MWGGRGGVGKEREMSSVWRERGGWEVREGGRCVRVQEDEKCEREEKNKACG